MQDKPTVYVLLGPTGSGKTAALHELTCGRFEAVSCDSRQIYKDMPVGTASPDESDRAHMRHHMIEIINPDSFINASAYSRLAREAIDDILSRGKIPIIVGGTGFYYMSIKTNVFNAPSDSNLTDRLSKMTLDEARSRLLSSDPDALLKNGETLGAGKIHPNDEYRIKRALEVTLSTGILWSTHWKKSREKNDIPYEFRGWHLEVELEPYKTQIRTRVISMIDRGFVKEAEQILKQYGENCAGLKSIGYREAIMASRGEMSGEELIERLTYLHYQYGRKQRTWFKREAELKGIRIEELKSLFGSLSSLPEKGFREFFL